LISQVTISFSKRTLLHCISYTVMDKLNNFTNVSHTNPCFIIRFYKQSYNSSSVILEPKNMYFMQSLC